MIQSRRNRETASVAAASRDVETTQTENTESGAEDRLPLDDAFDILCNSRRRHVLQYLFDAERDSVELGEIAEHVAGLENDKPAAEITSTERKRVYVGLYQNHLPRMDAVGVIEFDSDRKRVALCDHARELQVYLHVDPHAHQHGAKANWPLYNLVAAVCGGLALTASLVVAPLAEIRIFVVAGLVVCFLALSLGQLSQQWT